MIAGLAASVSARTDQSLRQLATRHRLAAPLVAGNEIRFPTPSSTLTFEVNSRRFWYRGALVWLNDAMLPAGADWVVSLEDARHVVEPLLNPGFYLPTTASPLVVLDPGHGGQDIGARGPARNLEKTINLDVARRVRTKLAQRGVRVRLTRDRDTTLGLRERTARAGQWGASAFVSIHQNAAAARTANGIETYTLPLQGAASTHSLTRVPKAYPGNRHNTLNNLLAFYVHQSLVSLTRAPDRGLRRARYDVLCQAPCPAILVECGFITNPTEERNLATVAYRENLAEGIARGILAYLSRTRPASPTGTP